MRFRGGSKISRRGHGPVLWGCGPPTWVLFGEIVCENQRIGSRRGGGGVRPKILVCRAANEILLLILTCSSRWGCNVGSSDIHVIAIPIQETVISRTVFTLKRENIDTLYSGIPFSLSSKRKIF